ncbi:hypothetical protein B0A54_16589 [Friedmanniomyces endolithicus]|uniref:Uncharacterized protein n=1 Tax=Friedmanniomyces endolithicus TaxID=329885 RepID=A0A4V5N5P5_9PEZI|nr:hypothetical protein B0A54_16589 [Friedmanniomyces endolithicus]
MKVRRYNSASGPLADCTRLGRKGPVRGMSSRTRSQSDLAGIRGGMMHNCWCVIKPEDAQGQDDEESSMLFRHPVQPGTGDGGWMQPSEENQIASAK